MVQIEGDTSSHDRKNVIKKNKKTTMVPICKSRKKFERDSPNSNREEEDLVWLFSQDAGQHESLWLSSESLSPLYKAGDFSIDEQLISFLSSYRGMSFVGGFNGNAIKNDLLEDSNEDDAESWLLDHPHESTIENSSSTALSTCSEASSLFWDLNRTDVWVSLINLEGEDCKWISNLDLGSEYLESDFPSPNCENKVRFFDVQSSDADVSSSLRSFHDELSSEILSGSLDLDDMEFDEPLMWPFSDKYDPSYSSYIFCPSPRKGHGSSISLIKTDGKRTHSKEWWNRKFVAASKFVAFKRGSHRIAVASRNTNLNRSSRKSMKMMLSVSKLGKKNRFRKGNFVMTAEGLEAMSLIGIDQFPTRNNANSSDSSTCSSMDFDTAGLWVSLINLNGEDSEWSSEAETDWENGLNSNFPSPSYKNKTNHVFWSSDADDEPLFWPYAKDQNWSMAWDSFCVSPRKMWAQKDWFRAFGNPSSIRVRIHDQRVGSKRSVVAVTGLSASKIKGFKRGNGKKGNAKRAKAMNARIGSSVARKFARSVGERMDVIMENDAEGAAVEKIVGFQEFDGHEGLDVKFHTESFSILEE